MLIDNVRPDPVKVREWTTYLRTTPDRQGHLSMYQSEEDGYCCLGQGCRLAQIDRQIWVDDGMAPIEFIEWLGFDLDADISDYIRHYYYDDDSGPVPTTLAEVYEREGGKFDLLIDWPADPCSPPDDGTQSYRVTLNASTLNDWGWTNEGGALRELGGMSHFTLAQIADIVDYFGICGVDLT